MVNDLYAVLRLSPTHSCSRLPRLACLGSDLCELYVVACMEAWFAQMHNVLWPWFDACVQMTLLGGSFWSLPAMFAESAQSYGWNNSFECWYFSCYLELQHSCDELERSSVDIYKQYRKFNGQFSGVLYTIFLSSCGQSEWWAWSIQWMVQFHDIWAEQEWVSCSCSHYYSNLVLVPYIANQNDIPMLANISRSSPTTVCLELINSMDRLVEISFYNTIEDSFAQVKNHQYQSKSLVLAFCISFRATQQEYSIQTDPQC